MNLKKEINLVYFGSPYFSADFLEKILTDTDLKKIINVRLVVTQSDKPVGRKQILTETPVKTVAKKYGIKILEIKTQKSKIKTKNKNFQTEKHNKKFLDLSSSFKFYNLSFDLDLCLVYAFSQIIPKDLLNIPKLGFWNIHPSLLPKYRGPSPIAYSLIFGEIETGVTIIKMDEKIDHGPIIAQEKLKIEDHDRRPDLEKKLTNLGFNLFKKTVFKKDSLYIEQYEEQNHNIATYSKLLKKQDGFISLSTLKKVLNNKPLKFEELPEILKTKDLKSKIKSSSKIIYDFFRGLYPWPGIWTLLPNGKRLKIIDMNLNITHDTLHITKVQLEGKKEVDFETFNRAHHIF